MFNKSLMFIAVGLFVSSAHAESKYVEFSIRAGDKTTSVTTEMGKPTLWESINKMSSACSFTSDNAGTPTIQLDQPVIDSDPGGIGYAISFVVSTTNVRIQINDATNTLRLGCSATIEWRNATA